MAHTLGTCDFFLARVLPYSARVPLRPPPPPESAQNALDGDLLLSLFLPFLSRSATEKGYVCIYRYICIYIYIYSCGLDCQANRKTPATLASALVVSTPETTRGLYTLPSRKPSAFTKNPRPLRHACRLAGKSKFYVPSWTHRRRSLLEIKGEREMGGKRGAKSRKGGRIPPLPDSPPWSVSDAGRYPGRSAWSLYGDTHARHCGDFLFLLIIASRTE